MPSTIQFPNNKIKLSVMPSAYNNIQNNATTNIIGDNNIVKIGRAHV